ncbi:hypothetical protein CTI12_AA017680 [Artemisia annua]|uniref:Helitron helicase-like domain-containing protein n=1 Tax=Artemisia annua TaxID=35608 RepID=A0A2U1QKG3_ARTAN|nr:hypothetical protein CTI12_AA017680 [Artemisia annua]
MKTKQKAVRRCSYPLDLAPDVGKMKCDPETSKRKGSVCGDIVNSKRFRTNANVSCQISTEPSQKYVNHKQKSPDFYQSGQCSLPNSSSIPECSTLSANKSHNLEGIPSSFVGSHTPAISRYATAKVYTCSQTIDTVQGKVSLPVNGTGKNCQRQGKKLRTQPEVTIDSAVPLNRKRKTNLKRHRHITAGYSPMESQPPYTHDGTPEVSPNTPANASISAKRPRFIQVTPENSNQTHHYTRTNARQQRRLRKGPPDTYISIGSCNQLCKYCNALFWYDEGIKMSNRRYPEHHRCCNEGKHFKNSGSRLKREIVQKLKDVLDEYNELVKLFRTARDKMEDAEVPDFKLKLFGVVGSKQYDLPSGDSIGAVVVEGGPDFSTEYDVVIQKQGGQPEQIDKLNPHYMSLHFPLIFIHGEVGYHLGLKLLGKAGGIPEKEKQMSMKMFYATMAGTSNTMSLTEARGKEIIAQEDSIKLVTLKATDLDKTIHVKVYRKWTITNKASMPSLHCCILVDKEETSDVKPMALATEISLTPLVEDATPSKTPDTPTETDPTLPETTSKKDEKKKGSVRKALFQNTRDAAETPVAKKNKKNE